MTVVVSFLCSDGAVVAADSMLTPSLGSVNVGHVGKGLAMDARLFYNAEPFRPSPIDELSDVRLVRSIELAPRGYLPAGSEGTVVAVHGAGEAYTVEFEEPFHALLLLEASKVAAIPGATPTDPASPLSRGEGEAC